MVSTGHINLPEGINGDALTPPEEQKEQEYPREAERAGIPTRVAWKEEVYPPREAARDTLPTQGGIKGHITHLGKLEWRLYAHLGS